MRSIFHPVLAAIASLLLLSPCCRGLDSSLTEEACREAYFLGQRRDNKMADFLAKYSKHLPAPKTGPYVSDVTLLTPFAQMVYYSSRQSMYNAQQAELDGKTRFSNIEIRVTVALTDTYGAYIPEPPASSSSGNGIRFRRGNFWREFDVRVVDGESVRAPNALSGEPIYRCTENDCQLVGAYIHLTFPADSFATDDAIVEVSTPDGQFVSAEFDLVSLR